MEIELKCKWCEVEMPESELNSEGFCDRCDRAIESKEGKKEDYMEQKYLNHSEKIVFPHDFEAVGLIDASDEYDEMPSLRHPDFDRLTIYAESEKDHWSVEFDGSGQEIIMTTSEVFFFLRSLKQFALNIERFFSDEKEGNLKEYVMALSLISNNLDSKIRTANKLRMKRGGK